MSILWLSVFFIYHLSSKHWSIWFEGLLIAQLEKKQEYYGFLVLEYYLKGWVPKGMGIIYTSNFTFPVFQFKRGKETCRWCCTHPSLKGSIFAGFQVHLYFCSRGGLFQGIPVILHVWPQKTLGQRTSFAFFLWTVDVSCKLLMFPVILIFPEALYLLQCLAYCSEQWHK